MISSTSSCVLRIWCARWIGGWRRRCGSGRASRGAPLARTGDVGGDRTGEAGDGGALGPAGDLGDGLEVAVGGDGEAGFDDVHAHRVEQFGHRELLIEGHRGAGALLAVAQSGVEDQHAGRGCRRVVVWSCVLMVLPSQPCRAPPGLVTGGGECPERAVNRENIPKGPGTRPDGPQGRVSRRSRRSGAAGARDSRAADAAPAITNAEPALAKARTPQVRAGWAARQAARATSAAAETQGE